MTKYVHYAPKKKVLFHAQWLPPFSPTLARKAPKSHIDPDRMFKACFSKLE